MIYGWHVSHISMTHVRLVYMKRLGSIVCSVVKRAGPSAYGKGDNACQVFKGETQTGLVYGALTTHNPIPIAARKCYTSSA